MDKPAMSIRLVSIHSLVVDAICELQSMTAAEHMAMPREFGDFSRGASIDGRGHARTAWGVIPKILGALFVIG